MAIQIKPDGTVRLRFSELLEDLGWTQKELAEKAGISINGVSNLRTASLIRYETLAALVEASGWPVERLLVYEPGANDNPA